VRPPPRIHPLGSTVAPGDPTIVDTGHRSKLRFPARSPTGSIANLPHESIRRPLAWPRPGSRPLAAGAARPGSSLQPTAVLVVRHGPQQSGMVFSLATLLSMLENIAQRLSRLWTRVANLNKLTGNPPLQRAVSGCKSLKT